MGTDGTTRRTVLAGGACSVLLAGSRIARAQSGGLPQVKLVTNWFAQAEHGGFYQAKETGLYEKAGVDVAIEMGGPQMNDIQLLVAGRCDVVLSQPDQVMKGLQNGLPLVAIATTFQKGLGGLMTHPSITDLSQLKGHPILISEEERAGAWQWLQKTYGYSPSQAGTYTFNLQPFVLNPELAMQAFATSEPYAAQKRGIPYRFFLLSDYGYGGFGNLLVTTRPVLQQKQAALAAFLKAGMEGWKSFLEGDNAPAKRAIMAQNPSMSPDQIDWSVTALKRMNALGAPGARFGRMNDAQWAQTARIAASIDVIPAALDWRPGYTLQFDDVMTATV